MMHTVSKTQGFERLFHSWTRFLTFPAQLILLSFFPDNNAYFSFVGGVPLKELNALEVEFLSSLNFDFYINTQTYQYFYGMVIEGRIHQGGCTCASLLDKLPPTVEVSEYVPSPDVLDFPPQPSTPITLLNDMGESDVRMKYDTLVTSSSSSASSSLETASQSSLSLSTVDAELDSISNVPNHTSAVDSDGVSRTPKQLTAAQLHTTTYVPQRSVSPVSNTSVSISESPVSSIGSYSSVSSYRQLAHHTCAHASNSSPPSSSSLSSMGCIYCFSAGCHTRYATDESYHEDCSTPRQDGIHCATPNDNIRFNEAQEKIITTISSSQTQDAIPINI